MEDLMDVICEYEVINVRNIRKEKLFIATFKPNVVAFTSIHIWYGPIQDLRSLKIRIIGWSTSISAC
jgi:hypothetical protein